MAKFKRIAAWLLVLVMCLSYMPVPSLAATLEELVAVDGEVTLDGTNGGTVTVAISTPGSISITGLMGEWSVNEKGSAYMTLTELGSDNMTFTGNNDADPASGYMIWMDESFSNPAKFEKNQRVIYATYTVAANTPAGEYVVTFDPWGGILDADWNEYYDPFTCKITVSVESEPEVTDPTDPAPTDPPVHECVDVNKDHKCDNGCDVPQGEHKSNAAHPCQDGTCDYCGKDVAASAQHKDEGKDHKCDACGTDVGEHKSNAAYACQDGTCNYCGEPVAASAAHSSTDNDHNCDVCGAENIEGHTETTVKVPVKEADCDDAATFRDDVYCSVCDAFIRAGTVYSEGTSLGHTWGDTTYDWSADGKTCTAAHACEAEGCEVSETETVTATKRVTTEGTCITKEVYVYDATFVATWATKQTSAPITGEKDMDNHTSTEFAYEDNNNGTHTKKNACCGTVVKADEAHTYTEGKCVCEAEQVITVTWYGADGVIDTDTIAYNEQPKFEGATPNKDAVGCVQYFFAGWSTEPNGEGTKYEYGAMPPVLPAATADVAYYAYFHEAPNHVYQYEKTEWLNDYATCVVYATCTRDESHTTTETMSTSSQVTTVADCQTAEVITYTANFAAGWAGTQSIPVTGEKNKDNHTSTEFTYVDNGDGTHTKKNACCDAEVETVSHTYDANTHKCACEAVEQITVKIYWNGNEPTWTLTKDYGTESTIPTGEAPYKFEFVGYATSKDGEVVLMPDEDGDVSYTFTESIELYPVFEQVIYNLHLTSNIGDLVAQNDYGMHIGEIYEDAKQLFDELYDDYDYPVPPAGYKFDKFTYEDGTAVEFPFTYPAEDLSIVANFKAKEYTLTIQYGKAIDGACKWVEETLSVPYGTKLIDLEFIKNLPEAFAVNWQYEVGQWIRSGTYAFGSDKDTLAGEDTAAELTMPAHKAYLDVEYYFTGWCNYGGGWSYRIINKIQKTGWTEIDGSWYYLDPTTGIRAEGLTRVPYPTEAINGKTYAPNAEDKAYWEANKDKSQYTDAETAIFVFGADGKFQQTTGLVDGGKRYAKDGMVSWHPGMVQIDGEYYYFGGDKLGGGNIAANGDVKVTRLNGIKGFENNAIYNFANGKLSGLHGISNGKYYQNSKLMRGAGLVKIEDGKYIFVRSLGQLATGDYWVTEKSSNGLCDPGMYTFDENGFMVIKQDLSVEGIVDGVYYKNGKPYYAGLIEIDGHMYYIRSNGQVATGEYYVTKVNDTGIAKGTKMVFGADGKMEPIKNGIVEENGKNFYYENNKIMKGKGVVKLTDENGVTFYIYVKSNGQLATGIYWPSTRNDLLPRGGYNWGTDGRYYPKG